MDQEIELMREGMRVGLVLHKSSVVSLIVHLHECNIACFARSKLRYFQETVPSTCDSLIKDDQLFMKPFEKIPNSISDARLQEFRLNISKVVKDQVKPAFEKIKSFITEVRVSEAYY